MKIFSDLSKKGLIRLRQKTHFGRTSYPFISGDAFRDLADGSIDTNNGSLAISDPKVLFISSEVYENNPGILNCFPRLRVLMIGNGDTNFSGQNLLSHDLKLILCQNLLGSTLEGLRVLPNGLENRRLGKSGIPRYFRHRAHAKLNSRIFKVLIPPMSQTNILRKKLELDLYAETNHNFDFFQDYLSAKSYFNLVRRYRFVLCLEGNGFDTHRLWEALYLECFPVVLNSPWSQELKKMGLPILLVDELSDVTLEVLLEFEDQNKRFCSLQMPQLWMPYWQDLISESLK